MIPFPPLAVTDRGPRVAVVSLRSALAGFSLDALIALVTLFALSLLAGLVWAGLRGIQWVRLGDGALRSERWLDYLGQPSAVAMLWMTLASTGGAALLLYAWRHRASAGERRLSGRSALRWSSLGWTLAAAALAFVFSTVLGGLALRYGVAPAPSNQAVVQEGFASQPRFLVAFVVLIAPAYEELLFRRVLFGRLWVAGRPWLGVVLSSAAFALMHEPPGLTHNPWPATLILWLTYGFMGAVFAAVYWRTRTLWAAYLAHALNNAAALLLMKLYGGG